MSYFSQHSEGSATDSHRRKDIGTSLAVDILRGHNATQADYTIGCLTESSSIERRSVVGGAPTYPQGVVVEDKTGDVTAQDPLISNEDTTIQPLLKPAHPQRSQTGCVSRPEAYENMRSSSSFQRRAGNVGWNGVRARDGWRVGSCSFYENPFNRLSLTGMPPTEELTKMEESVLQGEKYNLWTNKDTSMQSFEKPKIEKVGQYLCYQF